MSHPRNRVHFLSPLVPGVVAFALLSVSASANNMPSVSGNSSPITASGKTSPTFGFWRMAPCPDLMTNPGVAPVGQTVNFPYRRFEILGDILSGQAGAPPLGDSWLDNGVADGTTGVLMIDPLFDPTMVPAGTCPFPSGVIPAVNPSTGFEFNAVFAVDGNWGNNAPAEHPELDFFAGMANKNDDLIQPKAAGGSPWTWDQKGGGPQKNDITNVYIHSRDIFNPDHQPLGRTETWIFLAAETRATQGDQHLDFEFNAAGIQVSTDEEGLNPVDFCDAEKGFLVGLGSEGGRTLGDFIVSIDYSKGGGQPEATFRQWEDDGAGNYSFEFIDMDMDGCPDPLGVDILAATNASPLMGPWGHFDPDGGAAASAIALQFVEVGINLTAIGALNRVQCNTDSTVQVKTRSSDSFEASLKDFKLVDFVLQPPPLCEISGDDTVECGTEMIVYTVQETTGAVNPTFQWRIVPTDKNGELPEPRADATFTSGNAIETGASVMVDADAVCDGAFALEVTVTDEKGCFSTCLYDVCVVDTTDPIIGSPGPNATIECPETPSFTPPTASDNCGVATVMEIGDVTTPGCGNTYSRTKTWKAVDECGNESDPVMQTITVEDNTAPTIGSPGPNATIECPAVPSFTPPTASDTCGNATVMEVSDVTTPSCGNTYSRTKTWKAVDDCGNESDPVMQTIIVQDKTAPTIGSPGPNATIECPATPTFTPPTASDTCGNATVMEVSDVTTPGCGNTYSRTKTWKAVDDCGNESDPVMQTITVEDTTAPMIGSPGPNATIECPETPTFTPPTASDTCGNATVMEVSDVTTPGCGNTYSRTKTWKAVDDCGNESDPVMQTITVEDTTAPMIGNPGPSATLECPATPTFTPPTASDTCGNATVMEVSDVTTPGCGSTYSRTKTWKAVDDCGNESDPVMQTITVEDNKAPEIMGPQGCILLECREEEMFLVSATDDCDPDPDVSCELTKGDPSLVWFTEVEGGFKIELRTTHACGEVEVTCTAVDDCGNKTTLETMFECVDLACRLTAGGNARNSENPPAGGNHWSVGGQVGAPTHVQPYPCGEWTHRQHKGSEGKWTFHAGTASAIPGTAIVNIDCRDEGTCTPSGNPPSPAKDVDFQGVGSFRNVIDPGDNLFASFYELNPSPIVPHQTLHWFEVHTEDLGEPGNQTHGLPTSTCPEMGTPDSEGQCECPDFYSITIYLEPDHPGTPIYKEYGYLEGGNFQTHAPTNGSTCVNTTSLVSSEEPLPEDEPTGK